jgi:hypothetical protein
VDSTAGLHRNKILLILRFTLYSVLALAGSGNLTAERVAQRADQAPTHSTHVRFGLNGKRLILWIGTNPCNRTLHKTSWGCICVLFGLRFFGGTVLLEKGYIKHTLDPHDTRGLQPTFVIAQVRSVPDADRCIFPMKD